MRKFKNIIYCIADFFEEKGGVFSYLHFPSPKILFIILLYSASFSLFLAGVKHIQVEQALAEARNIYAEKKAAATSPQKPSLPEEDVPSLQNHLSENILRLHVTADDDTVKDQTVKLKVRDAVIGKLRQSIKNASTPAQAEELIRPQISTLTEIAQKTLIQHGCSPVVRISIENRQFPEKTYGDMTFPAGTYRALCIDIGTAQGQNWWCVLFPSLCFIDETTATVPEESKKKLRENLTEEEFQALQRQNTPDETKHEKHSENNNGKPEVHSALFDWFYN